MRMPTRRGRAWLACLFLVTSLFGIDFPPTPAAPAAAPKRLIESPAATETVVERFKIAKGRAFLLLPVELKGRTLLFALDTGASSSVYDSSLAPLLGEPAGTRELRTSDGVTRIQVFKPADAKLGRLSLRTGSPAVVADLRRMREVSGEEVYGFIGMDFLSRHVFRIDPDRGEVVFVRPSPTPANASP